MTLDEIAKSLATSSFDPDEMRILAAACKVAGDYMMDGSTPTISPFEGMGGKASEYLIGALLDG